MSILKKILNVFASLLVCLLLLWVVVGFELFFQTDTGRTYRDQFSDSCLQPIPFNSNNDETMFGGRERCAVQTHSLLADTKESNRTDHYKLAFLEFEESTNSLSEPKQLDALTDILDAPGAKFVIVFVHGWRHDAEVGNGDVARFRTFLAYSRKFLNQRANHAESDLVGVYIGWRGRSFAEPTERTSTLASAIWFALTGPSIYKRKRMSEKFAPLLVETLDGLENRLNLRKKNNGNDRMLIVGHSLGGNMIATGLLDRATRAVSEHVPGDIMPPLLGDLVVLINPAAEARKWTSIQRMLRLKGKVGESYSDAAPPKDWYAMFPVHQRPHFISVTSACNWAANETQDRKKPKCDFATREVFPFAHFWRDTEDKTTIGHLVPDYRHDQSVWSSFPYGSTHEILTNAGARFSTKYENIPVDRLSACHENIGWLRKARSRVGNGAWTGWDSAYSPQGPDNLLIVRDATNTAENSEHNHAITVQLRNSLWLSGLTRARRSVSPGNSPFWNMRAFQSTADSHGGYVNYPFWCTINQLVLDDIID